MRSLGSDCAPALKLTEVASISPLVMAAKLPPVLLAVEKAAPDVAAKKKTSFPGVLIF
jgi:hypothetical protein